MRADRLLSIILLLQTRGKMTSQVLARELGVARRTILRDIDALSFAGVPIYAEGGHRGGVALDENYRTSLTGLQAREVRTLFIASNTQLLSEIGLGEAARSTLLKLMAVLPAAHQSSVEHIRQRILIDPLWWWRDTQPPSFWEPLQQAVYEDRRIRAVYEHHDGKVVRRVLEPYSLVAKSSVWYLIAGHRNQLRTYRVSRFHRLTLLEAHFRRRPDFDLPTYWQQHLQEFAEAAPGYRFSLRVHPQRLNFAKWLVPGRYEVAEPAGDDGWLTVHFNLESIDLAKMLVFGLGQQAEIVSPPGLRAAVLGAARELLAGAARR